MTALRLGTRRSPLALAQATQVADRLGELGHEVDLVPITTLGDKSAHALTTIGGTGVFAAAIRRALLDGEIDLAVHSLKDLPTTPEPGLVVAATPTREDPRDVLVARDGLTLGELPAGSVVTTLKNTVDQVVTEFGVAELHGRSISQRARALIDIAHPRFRDELERDAKALGYL